MYTRLLYGTVVCKFRWSTQKSQLRRAFGANTSTTKPVLLSKVGLDIDTIVALPVSSVA